MNKWHDYFMTVAEDSAKLSKDPKTKVGAVLVNNKKIKSIGYNGAPRNFPDDLVPTDSESEHLVNQKNTYMCHAELNAVLNYDNKISDLTGATLYVTISPCSKCACMLAQVGIKEVIYKEKYHRVEETSAAEYIFDTCGITYTKFNDLKEEE